MLKKILMLGLLVLLNVMFCSAYGIQDFIQDVPVNYEDYQIVFQGDNNYRLMVEHFGEYFNIGITDQLVYDNTIIIITPTDEDLLFEFGETTLSRITKEDNHLIVYANTPDELTFLLNYLANYYTNEINTREVLFDAGEYIPEEVLGCSEFTDNDLFTIDYYTYTDEEGTDYDYRDYCDDSTTLMELQCNNGAIEYEAHTCSIGTCNQGECVDMSPGTEGIGTGGTPRTLGECQNTTCMRKTILLFQIRKWLLVDETTFLNFRDVLYIWGIE